MKKLTLLILGMLLTPTLFAATANISYTANLNDNIAIVVNTQPNFGSFTINPSSSSGVAILANAGNIVTTTPNTALTPIANTGANSGSVTISGTNSNSVVLIMPTTITISNGTNSFAVTPTLSSSTCVIGTSCNGVGIGGSFPYGVTSTLSSGAYTGNGWLIASYQ